MPPRRRNSNKRVRMDPNATNNNNRKRNNTNEGKSRGNSQKISPTDKAQMELERHIASRPMELQTLMLHHGKEFITLNRAYFNKKNSIKRMNNDADYIPRSAKVELQLSCLKSTNERRSERITELQNQANDAVIAYRAAAKTVIIAAAEADRETLKEDIIELICTICYNITKAHIASRGQTCDPTTKLRSLFANHNTRKLAEFFNYTGVQFFERYKTVHNMQVLPEAVVIPEIDADAPNYERAAQMEAAHNAQQNVANLHNDELLDLLESVLYHPWKAFLAQSDENQRLLEIKKVSTAAMETRAADAAAMLIDQEMPADRQQLKDLIANAIKQATEPLQLQIAEQHKQLQHLSSSPQKSNRRGPPSRGASDKKKSNQPSNRQSGKQTSRPRRQSRSASRGRSLRSNRPRKKQGDDSENEKSNASADDSSWSTVGRRRSRGRSNRNTNRSSSRRRPSRRQS